MNRNWLYVTLILAAILLGAHVLALSTFAYWYFYWLDIPMHIFGGATIGAFLLAFNVRKAVPYFTLMFAVVLGWEVFEYIGSISTGQPDYWIDTTTDMINGLIGAVITYGVAKKSPWR